MKNVKILKVNDCSIYVSDLKQLLENNNIIPGMKFCISWKVNKRKKLKSYRFSMIEERHCEDCGHYTVIILRKSDIFFVIDNHCGTSYLDFNSFKK